MQNKKQNSDTYYEAYNLVFDGANYIDTGIKLYDTDKDFEIDIEFSISKEDITSNMTILYCPSSDIGYAGVYIVFYIANEQAYYFITYVGNNPESVECKVTFDNIIHYRLKKVGNSYWVYLNNEVVERMDYSSPLLESPYPVILGASKHLETYKYYFKGTINHIKIEII